MNSAAKDWHFSREEDPMAWMMWFADFSGQVGRRRSSTNQPEILPVAAGVGCV